MLQHPRSSWRCRTSSSHTPADTLALSNPTNRHIASSHSGCLSHPELEPGGGRPPTGNIVWGLVV